MEKYKKGQVVKKEEKKKNCEVSNSIIVNLFLEKLRYLVRQRK